MQPSAVVLAGINLLSSLSCLFVAAIAWRRRTAPAAYAFVITTLAISWWCLWLVPLALSTSPKLVYFFIRAEWLGIAIIPPAYLAFATQYVGGEVRSSWRGVLLLGLEPTLTVFAILTNDWLHMVYTTVPGQTGDTLPMAGHGVWWYVDAVYGFVLNAAATVRLGRFLLTRARAVSRSDRPAAPGRPRALGRGCVGHCVRATLFLDRDRSRLCRHRHCLRGRAVYRQLLEVMPLAQSEVFRSISDGIIVLDQRGRVLDLNPAAAQLATLPATQATGQSLAMVLPALSGHLTAEDGSNDLLVKHDGRQRSFAIRSSPLRDRVGRTRGEVVLLSETTERRRIGELEHSRELIIEAEERLRRPDQTAAGRLSPSRESQSRQPGPRVRWRPWKRSAWSWTPFASTMSAESVTDSTRP